jgi:hypothetical protein
MKPSKWFALCRMLAPVAVVGAAVSIGACAPRKPPLASAQAPPAEAASEYGRAEAMAGMAQDWVMGETRRTYEREFEMLKQDIARRRLRGDGGGITYCDAAGCREQ